MRIVISGTQNIGKTTLVTDFLATWPMYKHVGSPSNKTVSKGDLPGNKQTTKHTQETILTTLLEDINNHKKEKYVLFDRGCLDWLAYTLWSFEHKASDIDKTFIDKAVPLIKEAMRSIDINFLIPITAAAPVALVASKGRDIDPVYREEIDNILQAIEYGAMVKGECPFLDKEDHPPIIEVFGNPQERIQMIKLYIDKNGDLVDDTSILNTENIDLMESLLREQQGIKIEEDKDKKIFTDHRIQLPGQI